MFQFALPVFFLMIGAALLGFAIAWLWKKQKINELNHEGTYLRSAIKELKFQAHNLEAHSNSLHADKEKMSTQIIEYQSKANQYIDKVAQLELDKTVILEEFKAYRKSQQTEDDSSLELKATIAVLENRLLVKDKELQQLSGYFNELTGDKAQESDIIQSLTNEIKTLKEELKKKKKDSKKEAVVKKSGKWESKYKMLQLKLLSVTKERDGLKKVTKQLDKKYEDAVDGVLEEIKEQKVLLDFSRIGIAEKKKKDNLQRIVGIGPFIEKKLNALGIYRVQQISNLNAEDIHKINRIIELPPGHILQENWVEQAKKFK